DHAQGQVDAHHHHHHHDRVRTELQHEVSQVARHGGEVDEVGEHHGRDQDGEQHGGCACAFHQHVHQHPGREGTPEQREEESPRRAHASAFGGGENTAVDTTNHQCEQHRHAPYAANGF